ncbi:unnamed protein product [Hermetia illucens]|uniref:MARVEL domain-containing protein n=2 Tax=Hermetia illucens TaxID=343691 RepID=A0A7R8UFH5_HERIL|nr:plasmolipin isoform X2 [Hermetia illucens]XP_037924670.1 plasmolipin isoform X2 [Hermetia illucens]CAD7079880.1 unnamed protein product [Hermetia illucens]
MADAGFPTQHTTTTTATTTAEIRYDVSYIRTLPGLTKCICIVLNLLGFICIQVSSFSYHSRGSYFSSIAMTGFWLTGILLFFYIFHVCQRFYKIPWLKIEMIYCALWTILYLIAASLAAAFGTEAYSAAAFFGYCAMVAYGYDAFQKFKAVREGIVVQETRTTQQTTVTIA